MCNRSNEDESGVGVGRDAIEVLIKRLNRCAYKFEETGRKFESKKPREYRLDSVVFRRMLFLENFDVRSAG